MPIRFGTDARCLVATDRWLRQRSPEKRHRNDDVAFLRCERNHICLGPESHDPFWESCRIGRLNAQPGRLLPPDVIRITRSGDGMHGVFRLGLAS
jgi:hypothetical protein